MKGRKVDRIELVADPRISVDSFRGLIQQHSDEPYSDAKVSTSISALRATGHFSNVKVEVKPDTGGLQVTFVLEPALYFGVLDFPGALKSSRENTKSTKVGRPA
jgi:outer membrane protein insertion porin family